MTDEARKCEIASLKIAFGASKTITQITEIVMNYRSLNHCPLF